MTEFTNIMDLLEVFSTEEDCIYYLEEMRWGGTVVSPWDHTSKVYVSKNNRYKCKNTDKYFSVKTGTIFEDSKVSMKKWFMAIYLNSNHKKGISSYQLARDITVTQKTAWFMLQRIRWALDQGMFNDMSGEVEMDETFVGGKNKNRHKDKKVKNSQGRSFKDKTPIVGALERGGNLRCMAIPSTSKEHLHSFIYDNIQTGSIVHTDEWHGYNGIETDYDRRVVNHSMKNYANGTDSTNAIEGAWSHLKRSIIGVYHLASRKYMQYYANEFVFRYNTRELSLSDRFGLLIQMTEGRRLKYKDMVSRKEYAFGI